MTMKTITIFISDRDPPFQIVPSDGVDPTMGIRACRYGEAVFQQMAVAAEVERRLAEKESEEGKQEDDSSD